MGNVLQDKELKRNVWFSGNRKETARTPAHWALCVKPARTPALAGQTQGSHEESPQGPSMAHKVSSRVGTLKERTVTHHYSETKEEDGPRPEET